MTTDLIPAPWLNQTLADGRYLILDLLGDGGMAHVYRAWDRRFRRDVAIKAIKSILLTDANFVVRFQREITTVAGLQHAHILPVLDSGKHQGIPYAVFPYMAGGNLADRLREECAAKTGRLTAESLRWLVQIASALDFLHARNLYHRDVKPDNILFDADGGAYLSDFGVVRVIDKDGAQATSVTSPNMVLGTCAYMAPELISGDTDYNGSVDQYGLGVTLYEALAGEHPFKGSPQRIMVQHLQDDAKPLVEIWPQAPKALSDALQTALAKDPTDRFSTCAALSRVVLASVADLPTLPVTPDVKTNTEIRPGFETLLPGQLTRKKRSRWYALLVLLFFVGVFIGGSGAWFAASGDRSRPPFAQPLDKPNPAPLQRIVCRNGTGDFKSISEAVKNSPTGTHIIVKPGEYRESIVIDRFATIEGQFERTDENRDAPSPVIVVSDTGHCIQMRTNRAKIQGLTLRCQSADVTARNHGLEVSKGEITVVDCDIQSSSHAAVAVHGRRVKANLHNCRIHHSSRSVGLYIYRRARATVESCSIYQNKTSGATLVNGGKIVFRDCRIYQNKGYGVTLRNQEMAVFENCKIYENANANLRMDQFGNADFFGCHIYGGKDYGIFIDGDTEGRFENCHIEKNQSDGVCIQELANPTFKNCSFKNGLARGLHIFKGGRGTFENCDIIGNAGAGVVIDTGISNPTLKNCRILNNRAEGVQIYQAVGAFVDCIIRDNKNTNVRIWDGSTPFFKNCKIIQSNSQFGVYIENAGGRFIGCTVEKQQTAVNFQKGKERLKCTFEKCNINDNKIGIQTKSDGDGLIVVDCDLTNNGEATRFPKNSKVQFRNNRK